MPPWLELFYRTLLRSVGYVHLQTSQTGYFDQQHAYWIGVCDVCGLSGQAEGLEGRIEGKFPNLQLSTQKLESSDMPIAIAAIL